MSSGQLTNSLTAFILQEASLADQIGMGLADTERQLRRLLLSSDPCLIEGVRSVLARPSKRLRPLIAILGALAAGGRVEPAVIRGAAAVEALHLASLLHDDVIDEARLRGGLPTPNATLGNLPAVLLGDFFFARAMLGAARISGACFRRFLGAAETLVAGEFGQACMAGKVPDPDKYIGWLEAKTASLFTLAASLAPERAYALEGYGHAFGIAYQLGDDLLDLTANDDTLGKPVMNDCRRGLYTYPVILACTREPASLGLLAEARASDPEWRRGLFALLHRTGAMVLTEEACRAWAARAEASLTALAPSPARAALARLAAWAGGRQGGCTDDSGEQ